MDDTVCYGDARLPSLCRIRDGKAEGGFTAVVVGSGGGIGGALCRRLAANPRCRALHACSRRTQEDGPSADHLRIDLDDEGSIAEAAGEIGKSGKPALIVGATGMLHDPASGLVPEKTWRHLSHDGLMRYYRSNCVAPAMLAKHFLPLMPGRGKAVFALLSGRVGSIADNRKGGWHGYRAAKAGLNMLVRNFALEMQRHNPDAVVLGLHPGTVATELSAPFRGAASHAILTPDESAGHLLSVIDAATPGFSGSQLDWQGKIVPE